MKIQAFAISPGCPISADAFLLLPIKKASPNSGRSVCDENNFIV
ncbi:hypothetical protein [Chryseobacterium culicis]|nr:hypothetical protein [Chryseobacterium culicis]